MCDYIAANIAFFVFDILRYYIYFEITGTTGLWGYIFSAKLILEQVFFPIGILGIFWLSGYYNYVLEKSRMQVLLLTLNCSLFTSILIYLILLLDDRVQQLSLNYLMLGMLFVSIFLCTFIIRIITITISISKIKRKGIKRKILLIGNKDTVKSMFNSLSRKRTGYLDDIVGFISTDTSAPESIHNKTGQKLKNLGRLENLIPICTENEVNEVILTLKSDKEKESIQIIEQLFPLDISIKAMPDSRSFMTNRIVMTDVLDDPLINLTSPQISDFQINFKRLLDILVSIMAIIILLPVYLILSIIVKLSSKGPVIYSQLRLGRNRKPFKILKFRSMVVDAESNGPQLSNDNDPRITKFGKVMRKYRLDELPQFWNVLKGDMSIVGPRPEREYYLNRIIERVPYYSLIFQIRPGITSWGMVKYGYASDLDQMVERTRYDLVYLQNVNILNDLKIALHTFLTVVKGKGL